MSSIVNKIKEKVGASSTEHSAAVQPSKGSAFAVEKRSTSEPGPNELLIDVEAVALNPVDYMQRDFGFMVADYPAVLGSDVGGKVIKVGSSIEGGLFKEGTRVAAFAPAFYSQGTPKYGALQQRVVVPADNATALPDKISFKEASLLPMAVVTSWNALYTNGITRGKTFSASDKQGILIWGGSSSIGSAGIQIAKLLGLTVYTTASPKHHDYLKSLGATKTFDYKSPNVEEQIINAAKEDGIKINYGYDAVGALQQCLNILKQTKTDDTAHLASAPPLNDQSPTLEGVDLKFVLPPNDEKERSEWFAYVFNVWLKEKLENGQFVPSPGIKVIPGGLESAQTALDELKAGVSGVKLVLEL